MRNIVDTDNNERKGYVDHNNISWSTKRMWLAVS